MMPLVGTGRVDPRQNDPIKPDLAGKTPDARRRAARAMTSSDDIPALSEALIGETDATVRQAIVASLTAIGGAGVAAALAPHLASDDTGLRTAVVAALKELGESAAGPIRTALSDDDPDVRIMALDVLQDLACADAVNWLEEVLTVETHPNVAGTALDRLVEIGTPDQVRLIRALPDRFPDDPYIAFAAHRALSAIVGGSRHET